MSILCLDIGTKTGYAYETNSCKDVISGVEQFKNGQFYGGGMVFLNFRRWLNDLKSKIREPLTSVYFEEVRSHKGTAAAHKYGGFIAILTSWCEHHNIPYQGVGVGTIKKYISGKGNASKQEVIAAVVARGYNPKDDNEADAIALLNYVLSI